mgnify:CR=1 FL=1
MDLLAFLVHVALRDFFEVDARFVTLGALLAQASRSLSALCDMVEPADLCVENLEDSLFDLALPLIEQHQVSICLDVGHLALQGGGAHGAFTWGVLDRLLCEDDLEIAAISGTSAGALNGAALKAGMIENGAKGARDQLDWLWREIGARPELQLPQWMLPFSLATVAQPASATTMGSEGFASRTARRFSKLTG